MAAAMQSIGANNGAAVLQRYRYIFSYLICNSNCTTVYTISKRVVNMLAERSSVEYVRDVLPVAACWEVSGVMHIAMYVCAHCHCLWHCVFGCPVCLAQSCVAPADT